MRPIGTNGKPMTEMTWENLNKFVVRANRKLAAKKQAESA